MPSTSLKAIHIVSGQGHHQGSLTPEVALSIFLLATTSNLLLVLELTHQLVPKSHTNKAPVHWLHETEGTRAVLRSWEAAHPTCFQPLDHELQEGGNCIYFPHYFISSTSAPHRESGHLNVCRINAGVREQARTLARHTHRVLGHRQGLPISPGILNAAVRGGS